ncbi:adenylate kinase family protein [Candidatus Mycoplasma mahonii]|uniref:adenylate kinase family protein n=1 Tax=Candidatus Mycoplasma mahonii TaxID=3004105 RepID=UPI0026EFC331|nr:nucleoside monophosphate kinase [Candidatus Mycoplasma mahonii]WKX02235.1 nucleoside monophosphate kinase [Candidatus Mycoplasma mahonii]
MIKNYIFLGPPGVGKGTLAIMLEKNKGTVHISTGAIFRDAVKNKTPIGVKVAKILSDGEYVPDEITNEIVKNRLMQEDVIKNGFALDGYPRTLNQAKFLKENKVIVNAVILLAASDKVVMERLLSRKRGDDDPGIIKVRIDVYSKKTKPLIDYYRDEKILIEVDAEGDIAQNYENMRKIVD